MLELFKKFLQELSPEDKKAIRDMLEDNPVEEGGEEAEGDKKVEEKAENQPQNAEEKVETKDVEETEETSDDATDKKDKVEEEEKVETKEENEDTTPNNEEEANTETNDQNVDNNEKDPVPPPVEAPVTDNQVVDPADPTVEEEHFINLDDIVTKDYLQELIDGFSSKFDAIAKENQSLLEQNAALKDKYEARDFGDNRPQPQNQEPQVETFDSYWKS